MPARARFTRGSPEWRAERAEKERARRKASGAPVASVRDYRARNPKKVWAGGIVRRAVEAGVLVRERCQICQAARAQAHHDDYDRPLDVRWLCHVHHKAWHAANGAGAHADGPLPDIDLSALPVHGPKTSTYLGVSWDRGYWVAQVLVTCADGKRRHAYRRYFRCEIDAAKAYDAAVRRIRGPRQHVNFPESCAEAACG